MKKRYEIIKRKYKQKKSVIFSGDFAIVFPKNGSNKNKDVVFRDFNIITYIP